MISSIIENWTNRNQESGSDAVIHSRAGIEPNLEFRISILFTLPDYFA
jgi:hypothetical protein